MSPAGKKFLMLICVFMVMCTGSGAAEKPATIRIGFFPMRGFHEYSSTGHPVGYDVDYLRRISSYTNWDYQFVRTETWDDALNLLAEGKIDLLGSAQMNQHRAERYEYSAYSSGTTHAAIIALSGNNTMLYEAFDHFDGARFGCVKTYVRKDDFAHYAKKKGFSTSIIWYDSTEQMRKALHAREIDAMVCSIMEIATEEKVVAEFSPAPFYYISTLGNTDLMDTLDTAIARLKIDSPDLESRLMDMYYPVIRTPSYSLEELAYIKKNPVLRVGQFVNRRPLSRMEKPDSPFTGIIPELLTAVEKDSGLALTYIPIHDEVAPLDLLKNGSADAVAGVVAFPNQIRDLSVRLTESFLTSNLILLGRKGEPFIAASPLKVAVPETFKGALDFVQTKFPHFSVLHCAEPASCLEAVQQRKADVTLQNAFVFSVLLHGPRYQDMAVIPTVNDQERLCIALPAEADPLLLSILNKSIQRLPRPLANQVVINHTVAKPYVITFEDFIFHYKNQLMIFGALAALCGILLVYSLRQRKKNIDLIRENEETLRNITNNINGGVITLVANTGFTITYANNGFLNLIGYTREEYDEKQLTEVITHVHQDDVSILNTAMAKTHSNGDTIALEMRILHKTGTYIPVLFRGTLAKNKTGQIILFCVVLDISEQRAMLEKLKIEKERYQLVVDLSNDIIFEVDLQQYTLLCSPRFKEKFGWQMDSSDINEKTPYPLRVHPEDSTILQEMISEILCKENSLCKQLRISKIDGQYLWCRLLMSCIRHNGRLIRLIGKIEDVDEMVREHERLKEISQTDGLCGLYNKRALRMSVELSLKQTNALGVESALFFIDIDNFKAVNDQLGHPVGDQALRDVASALRTLFRSNDIIGRYGGDEFCVFVPRISEDMVKVKASEINAHLRHTYSDDSGKSVTVSASVGIARSPRDGVSYVELVEKADRALYRAKEQGKNRHVLFTP